MNFYKGKKALYNKEVHNDGIFFTTDTNEIIANEFIYGGNSGSGGSSGASITSWTLENGVLTLVMSSGDNVVITFDEASETTKGLMSTEDKKKLNSLEENLNKKVDKVEGKSLVDDIQITKLSELPAKSELDSKINEAKNAGTTTQTNLDAHISNTENPHKVTKAQVGLDNVTNDAQVKRSEMGVANGVATLGEDGIIPTSQLPSSVDQIIEYPSVSDFPETGESNKIYLAKDTNLTYKWSGTQYTVISSSLSLGETSSTAYAGDKGKKLADTVSQLTSTVELFPDLYLQKDTQSGYIQMSDGNTISKDEFASSINGVYYKVIN